MGQSTWGVAFKSSSSQLPSVTDPTWKSMAFVTEFLVALGLVTSVVHASPLAATTSAAATDCRAFTVNRCNFDKNGLISTTFDEDDSFCTFLCQVGMADTCKYFVYDYPNKQCDLYSATADTDFSSYCDEEGGPALPVLANCAPSKPQTCSGMKYGNCNYQGEVIKTYPSITSESVCQQACSMASDCKYYLYEVDGKVCKLLGDDKRTCDLVINTKETDFPSCKLPDGTTTTEAPTTTTMNPDADCRNFTLNRCNFSNDTLITSVFQEDDEYCNFLCQVTYGDKQLLADKCSYFIYDYTNQQCDVYGSTWKDFPTFCNEKGGPLSPMVDNCRREHYCNGLVYANCDYDGDIIPALKEFSGVTTETVCQQSCNDHPKCQYYLYRAIGGVCTLLSDHKRKCDLVIGSKGIDFKTCKVPGASG